MGDKQKKLLLAGAVIVLALGWYARSHYGVNARDPHGMTALMRAAAAGNPLEVQRLLDSGAAVNAAVPSNDLQELVAFVSFMQAVPHHDVGYTALLYAAAGKHYDDALLLLDHNADVNHRARGGDTALRLAILHDDPQTAALLLDHGAQLESGLVFLAAGLGDARLVRLLLDRGGNVNDPVHGQSPLIVAARSGSREVVELLVDRGADLRFRDVRAHWTALHWAADGGHDDIAALLKDRGGEDPTLRNDALFAAVLAMQPEQVSQALAAGADPNGRSRDGDQPLPMAAERGDSPSVALLLQAGANVNQTTRSGDTALMAAAEHGDLELARTLLDAHAIPSLANQIHQTALYFAVQARSLEVAQLLLDAGAPVDDPSLVLSATQGRSGLLKLFLARRANANYGNGALLRQAAGAGESESVRALLDAGVSPAAAAEDGETALHAAALHGDAASVRLLLDHHAPVDPKGLNGETPLHDAAAVGHLEVVAMLIAAGADVNARDDNGQTPLQSASRYPDVQDALRAAGAR